MSEVRTTDQEMDDAESEQRRYAHGLVWVRFAVALLLPSAIVALWCLVWWIFQ